MPDLVEILFPVIAVIAVGFVAAGRLPLDLDTLSRLALFVCAPALVFTSLAAFETSTMSALHLVGGTMWIMLATGIAARIVAGFTRLDPRGLLLPAMFWNAGNLGLSLTGRAWGDDGLAAGTIVFVTVASTQAILASWIAGGRGGHRIMLRMPLTWAAVAGLTFSVASIRLPEVVRQPLVMLGDMTIPLLLLVLGMQLRTLSLASWRPAVLAVAVRLGIGFAAALGFVALFGVDGIVRRIILLESILPPAVITVMFARQHDAEPGVVAAAIVVGTLVSLILVPIMLAMLGGG